MDSSSINNTVTNSQVVDFLNRCDESSFILSTTSETSNALTVNPEQLPSCSRVPTVAAANVEYPEKNTVTESSESTKNKKFSHYSVVPMLIEDIGQITTEYSGLKRFHKIFGKSFGSIMIYGMICEVKLLNTSGSKELISSLKVADGTGIINVRYKHNADIFDDMLMSNIREETQNSAILYGLDKSIKNKLINQLEKLSFVIKKRINETRPESFKNGHHIFIIGNPAKQNNNEFCIWANSISSDNELSRDYEICFKNYLINFYKNIFKINNQ